MAAQELLQQAEAQWRQLVEPHAIPGMLSPHIGHLVGDAELAIECDVRLCFAVCTKVGVLVSRPCCRLYRMPVARQRQQLFPLCCTGMFFPARPLGLVRPASEACSVPVMSPCSSGCCIALSLSSSSQRRSKVESWEWTALRQMHQAALGLPHPLSMCRQKTLVMSCRTHNPGSRCARCPPSAWLKPSCVACACLHCLAPAGVHHTHRPASLL